MIRCFLQIALSIIFSSNLFCLELSAPDSCNDHINAEPVSQLYKNIPNNFISVSDSNAAAEQLKSSDTLDIETEEALPKWYDMITKVPGDWYEFAKQEIDAPNYSVYLLITGLTAGLIATDDYTWRKSNVFYNSNQVNRNWSDIFTEIGDGRSQFGFAAAFAAYGFIAGDHHSLKTASQIVEAVLAAGAVVQVLKHITGRESPFVSTKAGGAWRFFPNQIKYHKQVPHYDAFPSGHIATSVAAFTVIAENYPQYKWITPVSCGLTALIGIGMVNKGIHWYSDYPLGIAIGYAFGKLISHPEQKFALKSENTNKVKLSLSPYMDRFSSGVMFRMDF